MLPDENIRKANILLLAGPKLDAQIVNDMGIRKYDRHGRYHG